MLFLHFASFAFAVFAFVLALSLYAFSRRIPRRIYRVGDIVMPPSPGEFLRDTPLETLARRVMPYGVTVRIGPIVPSACAVGTLVVERHAQCFTCGAEERYLASEIVPGDGLGLVEERMRGGVCVACGAWRWTGPMSADAGFFGAFPRGEHMNLFDSLDAIEAGECSRAHEKSQLLRRLESRLERQLAYVRTALSRESRLPVSNQHGSRGGP